MKRTVSLVIFIAIICSAFTVGIFYFAISYDHKLIMISDDRSIIRDWSENSVLIEVGADSKEMRTDIAIDMRSTLNMPNTEALEKFSNKTKIYVLGTDMTKIFEYLSDITDKYYGFYEREVNLVMPDISCGFIGCSIELIDTSQTVFTYYFDNVHVEPHKQLEFMIQSDSSKSVYDNMVKYTGISQIDVYSSSSYYKIIPTVVCTNANSELQSIYYFNRLAVEETETLWDINNVINVKPKGEYQTLGVNCWLNVGTEDNERLVGFGHAVRGGSIEADIPELVLPVDVQCEPDYSSADGICGWNYKYTAGTTSAKGASTVSSAVRVANSSGQITVYPEINYITAKVYWLFGYRYSTSSVLYLSSASPSRTISFE